MFNGDMSLPTLYLPILICILNPNKTAFVQILWSKPITKKQ